MHSNDFNAIVQDQIEKCTRVLVQKGEEYAPDEDKLHNFKAAAALEKGGTARGALAGMMRKHTVSVYDMCFDDATYSQEQWEEKITDHINYLLLLKAIVVEEAYEDEPAVPTSSQFAGQALAQIQHALRR